jgi:mannan endo-1,4-beta-mannosidase
MTTKKINMKKSQILLFTALFFCQAIYSQSPFVKVKDHQFILNNKPWYYIGTNYWYGGLLAIVKDPVKGKERLKKELDFLHANGVNNLRVLAGVEGTGNINGVKRVAPSLQTEQGKFNTDLLKGLDYLLVEMGKRNMKAIIFLSNNWEWSGGFLQYLNWNGLLPDSIMRRKLTWDENRDYVKQFYTCDACKEAYRLQVKLIVNRVNTITRKPYKADAAIMSWELANEPRPMRADAIPDYTKWIDDASTLVKSFDKNHLVTTGAEGDMGAENLETFEAIHAFKNIDYLTIHIWPKNWGWFSDTAINKSFNSIVTRTTDYISRHSQVAIRLDKPLVVEEFGLPRDLHSFVNGSGTNLRDNYFRTIFTMVNNSRKTKGVIAGCNFWGFGGNGRAAKNGNYWWSEGDDYLGDPPPEEQGLNSVFDNDTTTWKLITTFTIQFK